MTPSATLVPLWNLGGPGRNRTRAEDKGIDAKDVALAVCLDKRHIFQIELGDDHYYFYSLKIKVQAAKRIGKYLELEESDYLYW